VGLRDAHPDHGGQRRPTLKVIEREIPYRGRGTELRLYAVADVHLGNRACDEARLDAALDEIDADAGGYWLTLGDNCDFIAQRDPRFDKKSLPRWLYDADYSSKAGLAVLQQEELARRICKRKTLGKKLLAAVEGNHEAMIRKYSEADSYEGLVQRVRDVDRPICLGASGFLVLRFRRIAGKDEAPSSGNTFTLTLMCEHGWGGGDLSGGVALKLEREMDRYNADIHLLGHLHKVQTNTSSRPITLDAELRLIQPPDRLGAVCGTFLRGRIADADTYAEVAGYRPSPASTDIVIRVQPDKGTYSLEVRNSNKAALL
jgi:hypothetical protein